MRDIQHIPWCGSNYGKGIEGRRVCIVGYSHYKDNGELDTDGFTVGVLEDVIRGARRIAFFTQIKNYFAFKEHGEFWNRVLFFNYVHGRPARRRDILPKCSDFVIRRVRATTSCMGRLARFWRSRCKRFRLGVETLQNRFNIDIPCLRIIQ
jgi:hypothetical protein